MASLLANLAALHSAPRTLGYTSLAVRLRRDAKQRYNANPFGYSLQVLSACVSAMEASGFIYVVRGKKGRAATSIALSESLCAKLEASGVEASDIMLVPGAECILLKHKPPGTEGRPATGVLVDYRDTPETLAMREEMEAINGGINAADIRYDGQPVPPQHLVRIFQVPELPAEGKPPNFNLHGRLYGGFWAGLEREKRGLITIAGEPVADLDFRALFLQIAYARQSTEPPAGDPYALPGLENHRDGVKKAVASLFAKRGDVTAMRLPSEAKELLPADWNMQRFIAAFSERHPAIVPLLGQGMALELMGLESRMLVAILLDLLGNGVVAMPMHDGLMVARSRKAEAVTAMENASLAAFGRKFIVDEKPVAAKCLQ